MADSFVTLPPDSTGKSIDTRTESTNSEHRQVMVLGDPTSNGAVASVQATDPASNIEGLVVRDPYSTTIVGLLNSGIVISSVTGSVNVLLKPGTIAVSLDPGHLLGSVTANAGTGSFNVQFDPGHTLGKVDAGLGTFNVQLDPGHTLGAITTVGSITNTVAVFFSPANPAVNATFSSTSMEVVPTTGSRKTMDDAAAAQRVLIVGSQTNASLAISSIATTVTVQFDPGHELGTIKGNTNTLTVFLPDTGHTLGNIGSLNSITTTVTVKLDPGNTLGKVDQGVGGVSAWLVNQASTASIFTVSGSTSGVSVSGVQLVAPSANASFKVFAFSLQTTGIVSVVARFTNGAGTSPTEFFRGLVTANQTSSTPIGANLAVMPPGYLFATGVSTTLALLLDTGTLVHYSVSYIKESA